LVGGTFKELLNVHRANGIGLRRTFHEAEPFSQLEKPESVDFRADAISLGAREMVHQKADREI
jgi:hypothetical protein